MDKKAIMEQKFYEKISYDSKKNYFLLSKADYATIIDRFQQLKNDKSIKKEGNDFNMERRYRLAEFILEGQKHTKLVKIGTNLRFVASEDLFRIIDQEHMESGHAGPRKMHTKLAESYANVTQQQVAAYTELCENCQLKKRHCRKSVVVRPIISHHMNSRAQVDLIDFQSEEDRGFKFIMTYQDHLTKYVALRALRTKTAKEVADHLIDIFCERGSPVLLQSDNGGEFCNQIINEVLTFWPGTKLIHGKPRHSQSQGAVERCNQEIRKMLACWKADNNTIQWADGLRFVQWQYNSRIHDAIKQSPYEAVFGRKPGQGLKQLGLPEDIADKIETEEQLAELLLQQNKPDDEGPNNEMDEQADLEELLICANCGVEVDEEEEKCSKCGRPIHFNFLCSIEQDDSSIVCPPCHQIQQNQAASTSNQATAKENLLIQAKRMTADSNKRFGPVEIGTTVVVPIPDVDRGRAEFPNVRAVVMEINEHGQYKLGTEHGKLAGYYARNQFTPCAESFLEIENVPDKDISLREAAQSSAMSHGQGFFKCNCKGGCQSRRCKCFSNNVSCNSKCHPNIATCNNKNPK